MEKACCLAFNTYPSHLYRELFWQITYVDVKTKIELYTSEKQAQVVQDFQSFMEVVKVAFGAKEEKKPEPVKTVEQAKASFAAVFG